MPVVVTLNLPNRSLLVETERLEKDPHLEQNLLLFGTKNLALPSPDEQPFITTVWSVPKSMIQFYAVGHKQPPAKVDPPPPAAEPPPFLAEAADALAADRARAEPPVEEERAPVKRKGGRKPRTPVVTPATE